MKLVLFLAAFAAQAQQFPADGVKRARTVMDAIFSLDHAAGEELCRDWIAAAPEDPGGIRLSGTDQMERGVEHAARVEFGALCVARILFRR